ncbi:flagellar P-ring protein precursor FlgI [Hypnocyclicus thermotrophus]|uniref:Flagellar P-ring protein n=1 Tax=Hypnocyclicus thermotrophus TaxID=1627895 RepID=A0AA46I5Z8_9FUSO|nr:flagellar basal body P-ring protein FlgI [Hypnocyclicus thermotrophus]TDT71803.1 flagellar P-ring protein precursor FlgI [Hypnocyclicus thermotrophus]
MKRKIVIILFLIINIISFSEPKQRIKEIARIEGVRKNHLIGMGLVVGLNGTGDSAKNLTPQLLKSLYRYFGTELGQSQVDSKNVAAVMVTAELPSFKKIGDTIDVTVSSINGAKSLEGGILLQTQLVAGNKVYALAQGTLSRVTGKNITNSVNGYIPSGATVEREVEVELVNNNKLSIILNNPDFTTASRVAEVINKRFNYDTAKAIDASKIEIKQTYVFEDDIVSFISAIENLEVETDRKSKIVIYEKSGTIILGNEIKVSPVAISHGDLSIAIGNNTGTDKKGNALYFNGSTVKDVVDMLNSIGATPNDIISILQALKASGAIEAEIDVR